MNFQQLASAYRPEVIYWGISSSPADTEAFIESLSGHMNAVPRYSVVFTVNASGANKIYFALPTRFGEPIMIEDGVEGGFILRSSTISVTGLMSVTQTYSLYESVSAGLGPTTLQVSW